MESTLLLSLSEAAQEMGYVSVIHLKLDDGTKVRNHKRDGNAIWEKLRQREQLLKLGLPLAPLGIWADFPAVKMGRAYKVHRPKLHGWLERHFGKQAA